MRSHTEIKIFQTFDISQLNIGMEFVYENQ